jgi:hypothetical protein
MARRLSNGCYAGQPRVRVRYFAAPNANKQRGGYCPVFRVNNQRKLYDRSKLHVRGDTFCKGYSHSAALALARADAREEALRHGGDYCVTIESSARGERGFAGTRKRRR